MRTKRGNGHQIDLEQFFNDITTVVNDGEAILKAGAEQLKSRAIAGARSSDRALRSHPYQSLGFVFGLGIIVGMLAASTLIHSAIEEED